MKVVGATAQKIAVTKNLADLEAESIMNRAVKTKASVEAPLAPTDTMITNLVDPKKNRTMTQA